MSPTVHLPALTIPWKPLEFPTKSFASNLEPCTGAWREWGVAIVNKCSPQLYISLKSTYYLTVKLQIQKPYLLNILTLHKHPGGGMDGWMDGWTDGCPQATLHDCFLLSKQKGNFVLACAIKNKHISFLSNLPGKLSTHSTFDSC